MIRTDVDESTGLVARFEYGSIARAPRPTSRRDSAWKRVRDSTTPRRAPDPKTGVRQRRGRRAVARVLTRPSALLSLPSYCLLVAHRSRPLPPRRPQSSGLRAH